MTKTPTAREAAEYLLKLKRASDNFRDFVEILFPDFKFAPFQIEIMEALDKLEKGTLLNSAGEPVTKLMLNMPVRHGKSFLVSTCFPLYYMCRDPRRKILAGAYGAELATTLGRDLRNLAQDPSVSQIFPDFEMAKDSQAANDWRTTLGGKYYSCGLDGSTSGRPANLLIWDDLLKNREAADSPTMRNKAWSHYTSALVKRLEPEVNNRPALEIGVMTRWHPDDPCGRIIDSEDYKEGDWYHLVFPAISMKPTQVKVARDMLDPAHPMYISTQEAAKLSPSQRDTFLEEPTALWPERFPIKYLEKQKRLDPVEFAALFQQEPFIKGGMIIKSTWWQTYTEEEKPKFFLSTILAVDTAFKTNAHNDYSVIMHIGITTAGDIYILDVIREKYEYPDLKRKIIMEHAKRRGSGLRGVYIEDAASGQSLIQDLRKEAGMAIIPKKVVRDKVTRLSSVSDLIEGGRVFIPKEAHWLDEFLNEVQAFPSVKHDDQVDALTLGLDAMSRMVAMDSTLMEAPLSMVSSINSQFDKIPAASSSSFKGWGE